MKGVSLVICTYNGISRLGPTIEHASLQRLRPEINWEVLIIDNNSTDGTSSFCAQKISELNNGVVWRIISEPLPGLSPARKSGVLHAQYDYVIFCDDDNWLCEDYLQLAFDIMDAKQDVGVAGGFGIPISDVTFPPWFENHAKSYAVGSQASSTGYVISPDIIFGAGMVLRKSLLLELYNKGYNSFLSDRKGNDLVSGGDNEICIWYRWAGYNLYFDQRLEFKHFIPKNRLTKDYLLKRAYGKGRTEAILRLYQDLFKGNENVIWVEKKIIWYFLLVKRIVLLGLINARASTNFNERLKKNVLKSSIIFRFNNYIFLKETLASLITLKNLLFGLKDRQ